jgi:hypothetical protein
VRHAARIGYNFRGPTDFGIASLPPQVAGMSWKFWHVV